MPKKKSKDLELNFKSAYDLWVERQNINRLETGTPIDELIGGGIEEGDVVEFYGEFGAGKSQISFTLTVIVAGELNSKVVFIDCENTFKPERIAEIAKSRGYDPEKVLNNILVLQPISVEAQLEALNHIPKKANPKLIVVDGVTTLFREEYIGRGMLAERQGLLRKFLRSLKDYVREHKMYGVVTNQVYGNPESSPFLPLEYKELAVGGHSLYHAIDNRIFVRKAQHGTRIARLVDSSRFPMQERPFRITEKGIEDVKGNEREG